MHALDKFIVDNLTTKYNYGIIRAENKDYKNAHRLTSKDRDIIEQYPELKDSITKVKHNRALAKGLCRTVKNDSKFSRLYYIRYADDYLLGYVGPKITAIEIYETIKKFLEDELYLITNDNKTSIKHSSNYTKFLGTLIRWSDNYIKSTKSINKTTGDLITSKRLISVNRPVLTAPINDIIDKFIAKKYCISVKSNKKIARSTSFRQITNQEDHVIVNRFNSIIRGLLNYYSFVSWKSSLWTIIDLLRKTCALTLADKHQ